MDTSNKFFICIGSNSSDGCQRVQQAIIWLGGKTCILAQSQIYKTPDIKQGITTYYNAVVAVSSSFTLTEFSSLTKDYEHSVGRNHNSSVTTIDIDIVVYKDQIIRLWDFYQQYFQIGFLQLVNTLKLTLVTYFAHSGFAIEYNGDAYIFDYYQDPKSKIEDIIRRNKRSYIFVTHSHHDHFNPEIFHFSDQITGFVISSDCKSLLPKDLPQSTLKQIIWLSENQTAKIHDFVVHTFHSTDLGVCYLLNCPIGYIFHAGDLNNWHWVLESTDQEVADMEREYLSVLERMNQVTQNIHIAMFPVDPNMGGEFARGARQFLERFIVDHFFVMHTWGRDEEAAQFSLYANPDHGKCYLMKSGESTII